MTIEIRPIQEKDLEDYLRIQQKAYPTYYQGSQSEIEKMIPKMKDRMTADDLFFYGAFINQKLVGGMLYLTFKMNFHGQVIDVHGIGSVAVDLLHKKKGIAKTLVLYALDRAKKDQVEIFSLYPFRPDFYENFGFGFGSKLFEYQIDPGDFNMIGDLSSLTDQVSKEDIAAFYDEQWPQVHGMKKKSTLDLSVLKANKIIAYKEENKILGYMYYKQEKAGGQAGLDQKIVVEEMIYATPKALQAFSTFFRVQKDQVDYIQIYTYDENFHQLLNNYSYATRPCLMPYVSHKTSEVGVGLMWRVMDASQVLGLIQDRTTYRIIFNLLHPSGEEETVTINPDYDKTLELGMKLSTFSSWVMGNISLNDLHTYGKLTCDQADLLKKLDHEFNFDSPRCYAHF